MVRPRYSKEAAEIATARRKNRTIGGFVVIMASFAKEEELMPPAARKSDAHVCGISVHGTNKIEAPCESTVQIGFKDAARMGDLCSCGAPIIKASATVFVGGQPAARQFDTTGHGGTITTGEPTVLIGDVGMGDCNCMKSAAASGAALVGDSGF